MTTIYGTQYYDHGDLCPPPPPWPWEVLTPETYRVDDVQITLAGVTDFDQSLNVIG